MKLRILSVLVFILLLPALSCNFPDNLGPYVTPFTDTPFTIPVLHVETTGNDANDCLTIATACFTVNGALGKAPEGAIIRVGRGTFTGNVLATDKHVTIRGTAPTDPSLSVLSAGGMGSAITINGDSGLSIEDLTITSSGVDGAGISLEGDAEPQALLFDVLIQDNDGVGIHVNGNGTANLEEAVWVRRNNGGILNEGGIVLAVLSHIVENTGSVPAIDNRSGGSIKMGRTNIAGNVSSSAQAVAIAVDSSSNLGLDSSAVTGNAPTGGGAAVAIFNAGAMALDNSTLSGNAGVGVVNVSSLRIRFTTIATNSRSGITVGGGPTTISNSIIENNGEQDCLFESGGAATIAGRVLSDGSCAAGAGVGYVRPPEGDLHLATLANNGGPTPTHALIEGSLAIDGAEGECLASDQRGETRPSGAACDAGSFEVQEGETTPFPVILLPSETQTATATLTTTLTATPKLPTVTYTPTLTATPKMPTKTYTPFPVMEPSGFKVTVLQCSPNGFRVRLDWGDVKGELGYRVYRDGMRIATLKADVTTYTDTPPNFKNHTYRVESFNKNTAASTAMLSSGKCAM
jgi:hypothetical protein